MVSYNRLQMMQVLLELYNDIKIKGIKKDDSILSHLEETAIMLAEGVFEGLDPYVPVFIDFYKQYNEELEYTGEFDKAPFKKPVAPAQKSPTAAAYKAGRKDGSTEMVDMMLGMYTAEDLSHIEHHHVDAGLEHQQVNEFHNMVGDLDFGGGHHGDF
jgi:hypothetical protein